MERCQLDTSIQRIEKDGFDFPLGVYPVEPITPKPGYTVEFEPADGDDAEGEWEEWPDRYVFDIVVPHKRLRTLVRHVIAMMPARVYPILDFIGHDAYREIDPYISYDLIGADALLERLIRLDAFFYEDGMVGFGAMSEEPFSYFFVDEHKILTIRVGSEGRERVEALLGAFGLEEIAEPAGVDAAAHEHRTVLLTPEDRPDLLGDEELVERLREDWRLLLNVDGERNVDDDGHELGFTAWRCVVRCAAAGIPGERYAEIIAVADSLAAAEELAHDGATRLVAMTRRPEPEPAPEPVPEPEPGSGSGRSGPRRATHADGGEAPEWTDLVLISIDRIDGEQLGSVWAEARRHAEASGAPAPDAPPQVPSPEGRPDVLAVRWLGEA